MDDRSYEENNEVKDRENRNPDEASVETDVTESRENTPPIITEDEAVLLYGEGASVCPTKKKKDAHSVPLLAFVASILIVLLVAGMFTAAISGAMYKNGYMAALSEAENGVLGDGDAFYDGEFAELEFLDEFFRENSYNDLSEVDFKTALLKAYVEASGDLYAEYYTQEEYVAMISENAGEGVGVGISVIHSSVSISGAEYSVLEVITVFPESPAEAAGLLPGDLIFYVGVDEGREAVDAIGYTDSLSKLRGKKGTTAEFTALRPENGEYVEVEFKIVRDEYTMQSVSYKLSETDPSVGIVKILQFDLTTPVQFSDAMDALIAKGVKKFVFDVRNNPGGDLKSISAVLSYFLEEGDMILSAEDKAGSKTEYRVEVVKEDGDYAACSVSRQDIRKYRGYDAVVLSNGNTASAAELFTAALRDYELATIVGETTYGKGSMQSIYPLFYWGHDGALKLTTRHYFPPCGEGYDGIGITPHVEVALSEEAASINIYKLPETEDDQLLAGIKALNDK